MILREDTETALIGKDDMYYTFERWYRATMYCRSRSGNRSMSP